MIVNMGIYKVMLVSIHPNHPVHDRQENNWTNKRYKTYESALQAYYQVKENLKDWVDKVNSSNKGYYYKIEIQHCYI